MDSTAGAVDDQESHLLIYNVPEELIALFPDHRMVIRSCDPARLLSAFEHVGPDRVLYLQLLDLEGSPDMLLASSHVLQLELVATGDLPDVRALEKYSELLNRHTVSFRLGAVPGCAELGKWALRNHFSVALDLGQPTYEVVGELLDVLQFFLHSPDISARVSLFYSLLKSFYSHKSESIWRIQEEHPQEHRYVTEDGQIMLSRRSGISKDETNIEAFLDNHKLDLFLASDPCCLCQFFAACEGYFKLPDPGYQCEKIQELFGVIWDAAVALRNDMQHYDLLRNERQRRRQVE